MLTLYKRYKWLRLCVGILLLVVGVLTIVISCTKPSIIGTTLSISLAVLLFISGGITILASLLENRRSISTPSLGVASILIALGVILCVDRGLISNIIVLFMASLALSYGFISLIRGIQLTRYKTPWYVFVACFIISATLIAFGILALCYRSQVLTIIYICVGAVICIISLNEIVLGIKLLK